MQAKRTELGFDQLVEDLFGLNIRGFSTIGQMFVAPSKGFEAARDPDWQGRFTPSVRLVFSILTVLGFLRFFWAGEETAIFQQFTTGFIDGAGDELGSEAESAALARDALGVYAASIPFAYLIAHGFLSQVVRVWGKGTGGVGRLRLHMLAIVPSMTFTLVASLLLPFVESFLAVYSLVMFIGVCALDFVTALRGGVQSPSQTGRIVKAFVFMISALIAHLIASILSMIAPIVTVILAVNVAG